MDEQPNNTYPVQLSIDSEEDLMTLDEATGERKYTPVTSEDVDQMKRETEHICKDIQYAIDEFQWIAGKHKSLAYYNHIYQNLAEQLADFLKFIYLLHKKVYITIYKNYDRAILDIYENILEKVLKEFQEIVHKHEDFFLNDYDSEKNPSISESLKVSLDGIQVSITLIGKHISTMYRTRWLRTDHETYIIYYFMKKEYNRLFLPKHLEHVVKVQKHRMKIKRLSYTTASLRKILEETEDKYNNYTLCSAWFDNVEEEDGEEALASTLSRNDASPKEFEILFQYQGEHQMWEKEIDKVDEYEHQADSFFVNSVDPYKLEDILKFWVKSMITKQQQWYIVWCLMKYTFHMVKEGQDKNNFARRMNLMFPDAEKKCIVESFRKLEKKKNHNLDFSEWLEDSDPDYPVAKSLYEKLKRKDDYRRQIDSVVVY